MNEEANSAIVETRISGPDVTATATDTGNNTSEFSQPFNIAAAPTPSPTPTPTESALIWGDNDCSRVIDGGDGLTVLIHIAGISAASASAMDCPNIGQQIGFPGGPLWGDVNCSGSIDGEDMIAVLRHIVGLDYVHAPDCALIGQEIGPL